MSQPEPMLILPPPGCRRMKLKRNYHFVQYDDPVRGAPATPPHAASRGPPERLLSGLPHQPSTDTFQSDWHSHDCNLLPAVVIAVTVSKLNSLRPERAERCILRVQNSSYRAAWRQLAAPIQTRLQPDCHWTCLCFINCLIDCFLCL